MAGRDEEIRALYSAAARAGSSGYFDYPEVEVRWAFDAGLPDPESFPIEDLGRIAQRVLREDADEGLQYGGGRHGSIAYGYEGLRDRLSARTAAREGRSLDRREVMLVSGGVQGLTLCLQAFLDRGDVIAVEAPTWGLVLGTAKAVGADAVAIGMDEEGLLLDQLELQIEALSQQGRRLKLVYTIATFNTPTGICLSEPRRRRLLALAEKWDFLILEDNVYGDLRYDGETLPTLFSLDRNARVIKVDSFSKTLAPALRLGWVSGHADALAALSAVRGDLGVSQWLARVIAEYLREDLLEPHIAAVCERYRQKRDAAVHALREHCAPCVRFRVPEGGYFLWLELTPEIDAGKLRAQAFSRGVVCRPGERFFGDQEDGRARLRLAFSMVPTAEIERGIAALGAALSESRV
ncbi:MAG: PLP-dependent aminotransferase family protein [Myxococcales bacterium]|nr:PLP-dependent aminotransferase family protein [Myxococcales bacterium]